MKRVAFLTFLLLVALAAPASAAQRCKARGEHVVKENAQARLFWVKGGKGEVKRRYLGCRRGHKPILVATDRFKEESGSDPYSSVTNRRFRLTGRWVAWVRFSYVDFGVGEAGYGIRARSPGSSSRPSRPGPPTSRSAASRRAQRSPTCSRTRAGSHRARSGSRAPR